MQTALTATDCLASIVSSRANALTDIQVCFRHLEQNGAALKATRARLLDYILATYALRQRARFTSACHIYLQTSLARVPSVPVFRRELEADIAIAIALGWNSEIALVARTLLSRPRMSEDESPADFTAFILACMVQGEWPKAQRAIDLYREMRDNRAGLGGARDTSVLFDAASAVLNGDVGGFREHFQTRLEIWAGRVSVEAAQAKSAQIARIENTLAGFWDRPGTALLCIARDRLGVDPAFATRGVTDEVWLKRCSSLRDMVSLAA